MSDGHLDSIKAIYDERSQQYDDSYLHLKQSREYIDYAKLKPGEAVLDLVCGTGLVTLLAKGEVGARGHVVGVDVSDGMLEVARRKCRQEGLDVVFVNRDVRDLDGLGMGLLPEGSKGFDVITCASALVLIRNPLEAVRHWASLLAPGGRLITDIPCEHTNLVWHILTDVVLEVGQSLG